MIKFEIDKRIASIKGDQVKAKRVILVTKATIKQLKVMVIEASKEWDRRRERRVEPRGKLVKVELNS